MMKPRPDTDGWEQAIMAPPGADVAALAAIVTDMGRWMREMEERLSALEGLMPDETEPAMHRLADYKLEVFYLPELADDDREELRDRAQAALEGALPGLAERLRNDGLLVVAEDDANALL